MDNWMPTILDAETPADSMIGKVFSDLSVFGSFFRFSGFAEDEPKIAETYFMDKMDAEMSGKTLNLIAMQIRPRLNSARVGALNLKMIL